MKIKYYISDILDDSKIFSTEEKNEYENFIKSYDETKANKLKFLNELYDNGKTIKHMGSIYNSHVVENEIELEKDVMLFSNGFGWGNIEFVIEARKRCNVV